MTIFEHNQLHRHMELVTNMQVLYLYLNLKKKRKKKKKQTTKEPTLNSFYNHPPTAVDKICPDVQPIKNLGVHIKGTLQYL